LGLGTSMPGKIALVCGAVLLACCLSLAQAGATSAAPTPAKKPVQKHPSAKTAKSGNGRKSRRAASRQRGQQKIDPSRTLEIQQALIREHYLSGDPSGKFDDATQQALRRYQAANRWQSKTVPDARALIKLGLGPDHEHLLNPESAMTMPSQPPHNAGYSNTPTAPDAQDKIQR
jgi:peptidoglycan hydrolase-like protein with peptidoglycan-binding domain